MGLAFQRVEIIGASAAGGPIFVFGSAIQDDYGCALDRDRTTRTYSELRAVAPGLPGNAHAIDLFRELMMFFVFIISSRL
jgi:hypothetical protein